MHQSILIVGANGQLGRTFRKLAPEYPAYRFEFTDVAELDLTHAEAVSAYIARYPGAVVVNCAAYTNVERAEDEPALAELINASAVGYLARACARCGSVLVHISTDYVFDGAAPVPCRVSPGGKPEVSVLPFVGFEGSAPANVLRMTPAGTPLHWAYTEESFPHPLNVYGTSKLHGEQAALNYDKSLVFRVSWLYSEFGNNFVKTMLRLGGERSEVRVVGDQIGSPTYAESLARAVLVALERVAEDETLFGLYHFSDGGICSWAELAAAVFAETKLPCRVTSISTADYPSKAVRPLYSVLSKAKITTRLGVPLIPWRANLQRCLRLLSEI